MPNLQWNGSIATTVDSKAAALKDRFYPKVDADLTDIIDCEFADRASATELHITCTATESEVYTTLKRTRPDKCPGIDEIPNRFLHAMGAPLVRALTALLNQCWAAEYFPKQFRAARTVTARTKCYSNRRELRRLH
jgi:hypothetical protein